MCYFCAINYWHLRVTCPYYFRFCGECWESTVPPWEMSLRKESTSLKLWGVATVVHLESSKSGTSALGTSSRMNLQSRLKFSIERGDLGGIYGPLADGAAANAG